jgi:2-polyprenyl-6-methoxyphenol hydroxylase-like FAD-dependent oxidoreductase
MPVREDRYWKTAIVLGAGVGGLVAARILSDVCECVLLLDRDMLDDRGCGRPGVPQAHHIHLLMSGGVERLEALYPGFREDATMSGAKEVDYSNDVLWFQHGSWKARFQSGVKGYPQTRRNLETILRRRTSELPNVDVCGGQAAIGLLFSQDRAQVIGVETEDLQSGSKRQRYADLVVDATGQGSRILDWLNDAGYQKPAARHIDIDLCYASRFFRPCKHSADDWDILAVYPEAPDTSRGGALHPMEGNRWLVSLFGYYGDHPPATDEGFLEYARSLASDRLYQAIKHAEPLSGIHRFKIPRQTWRRFEELRRFPSNLFVLGDALCRFDPVFGQGMTVAVLEALTLRQWLVRWGRGEVEGDVVAKGYFTECAKIFQVAWSFAGAEASRFSRYETPVGAVERFRRWYWGHLYDISSRSPATYSRVIRAQHMLSPPGALLAGATFAKVLGKAAFGAPRANRDRVPRRNG